jgi:hypothetical protein
MFGMDAVVSSLLPITNHVDPRVLPLMIDGAVWEERLIPLREEVASGPKVVCEIGGSVVCLFSFAKYACEVLPRCSAPAKTRNFGIPSRSRDRWGNDENRV